MRHVNNGTMGLRDAMRGVKVSVSFPREPSPTGFINMDENGAIKRGKDAGAHAYIHTPFSLLLSHSLIHFCPPSHPSPSGPPLPHAKTETETVAGEETKRQKDGCAHTHTHTCMHLHLHLHLYKYAHMMILDD